MQHTQWLRVIKNIREALKYLTNITLLLTQLAEHVEMQKDISEDLNELDLELADLLHWTEGVEKKTRHNRRPALQNAGF